MRLEAHQIVDGPFRVVPPQLHHGVGLPPCRGVLQPTRLQRAVAQGVLPPPGHHLHRHAALEDALILKAVDLRLLSPAQLPPERLVFVLFQRAVDIVRRPLVVPGRKPCPGQVDALKGHQRRGGVKEVERAALAADEAHQVLRHGVAGQRAGGHHHLPLRQFGGLPLHNGDVGMVPDGLRHILAEPEPVHRQRAPGLHAGGVGGPQDDAVQPPQLFLQKAHGVLQTSPPQGVGADQLRKIFACMGRGHLLRLHLPQRNGHAPFGQLIRGLASRQPRADDCCFHFVSVLPTK